MSHANARLTFHGRCELVRRVRFQGRPVAHVAREMGVSRACAHRWVARFDAEGWDGLHDRSSRPLSCPTRTAPAAEQAVLAARAATRRGPAEIARRTGVPERTVTRVLRRHGAPRLAQLDPVTGAVIRASKETAVRYERARPGDLIHLDVKKIGRIPDGGGWKAHGRQMGSTAAKRRRGSASTTSTPPSTTTPGSPTQRSIRTRRARPAPPSSLAPRPGSTPPGSP